MDGTDPKPKSFDTPAGKVSYNEIPLQYNYGTPEAPRIDSCFFECPEVLSFGGIVAKREEKPPRKEGDPPYIKESYSMMFTFNLQDEECVACLTKWDDLHRASCHTLSKHKGKIGMYSFNPDLPGENIDPSDWELFEQWQYARSFLYENRVDADTMLFLSRLSIIAVSIVLGLYIFFWGRELYGVLAGLFALFLYDVLNVSTDGEIYVF